MMEKIMSDIDKSKALEIAAEKLKHALSAIVPKKKKRAKGKYPLTLYSTSEGKFVFADSMYESLGSEIDCKGGWSESIEVDGYILKRLIETFPDDSAIILGIDNSSLLIRCAGASLTLGRLDPGGEGKTERKKLPHKGKVEHPPEPVGKRAEFHDTWGFSARVPMPESAVRAEDRVPTPKNPVKDKDRDNGR
jgi:hypothetical protein